MDKEIVKADPALRKKMIGAIIILALGGLLILWILLPMIRDLAITGDPAAFIRLIRFLIPALLIVPISLALWMIRLARKIISEECFPLMNQKVIRDTIRVTGKAARIKGYALVFLSVALILTSALAFLFSIRLFDSFV